MKMARTAAWLLLAALPVVVLVFAGHAQDADRTAITGLMRKTWERPNAPLSVDPVVVVGDYAIAGWIQDGRGGRALLRKKHGVWDVVLCSGDQLRLPDTVTATGVASELASRLVADLLAAEQQLPRDQLAKFSTFEGIVQMDATPPHHSHK